MSGPARGRSWRVKLVRAALPCLALIAFDGSRAQAQTVTPDLFRPVPDGFVLPQDSPLRRVSDKTGDSIPDPTNPADDEKRRKDQPAPSRIGQVPTYGLPAANGAADTGYDSLNRTRKKPKFYPGQPKPKPPPGPGTPAPATPARGRAFNRPRAIGDSAVGDRQQDADPARDGRHRRRPAAAHPAEGRRRSVRRGRRLRRRFSGQVGGRAFRRLRHQSRPPAGAAWIAVLRDRAGISRGLRLGPPRGGRRPARILHRLWQRDATDRRRRGIAGADRRRPSEFHRPYRRPSRRQPRSAPDRADAPVGRHRQSRQPEHPGRAGALSDLHHARRHLRLRPEFQSPGYRRRRHRRPHLVPAIQAHRRHARPPTTTATSISTAASAASATICCRA